MNAPNQRTNHSVRPPAAASVPRAAILLVDDEPLVLKMLETFLSAQDFRVITATGGQEALAIIERQEPIDLLLTDIRMPDMNGIRLMEAVRQLHPRLPVLLMTGYTDFDLVVEGLKQHAFDLLMKPIDFDQLTWVLTKALAYTMTQRLEQQYRERLEKQVAEQTGLLCRQLEELQQAQKQAGEVDELKRQFLNLISHEFRTPLHGISGAIQLLEEQPLPAKAHEHLAMLRTSNERLTGLVQDLLTLVEAQAQQPHLPGSSTTPCRILEQLKSSCIPKARTAGIRLELSCGDPADATLKGPWDALQIIAGCLLDNAIKFTGSGGTVTCRLWAEPDNGAGDRWWVLLEVRDNGNGIPLPQQEVIFKPFTQLEHYLTRRAGGIGIGLAIVRTLCDKLSGTLTLESAPQAGSCFTCGLPFTALPGSGDLQ